MIRFYNVSKTAYLAQSTVKRSTGVNGSKTLSGEVMSGAEVINGLDRGWSMVFDEESYVITYTKLNDKTNTVEFDAVQSFFWDFAKKGFYENWNGSHTFETYLAALFQNTNYEYVLDTSVAAFEKENWGMQNRLALFNDVINQAGVEFNLIGKRIKITSRVGSDLSSIVRKGFNLSDMVSETSITNFATYGRGYGAFKDPDDQSKGRLEVEYKSSLADVYGVLEADPVVDERYTIADNLKAAVQKLVDNSVTLSISLNLYDLPSKDFSYSVPQAGDWVMAIDEAIGFSRRIRIIQIEEDFDVSGNRIGYTATCGALPVAIQQELAQSNQANKVEQLTSDVKDAVISANGKNTNYYGIGAPTNPANGDLWFDQSNADSDNWTIKQWVNGRWEQLTINKGEVDAKVAVVTEEAKSAVASAETAVTTANAAAMKADDTNVLSNTALTTAIDAQTKANVAVTAANSTAANFGKVEQTAASALATALSAQSDAGSAVKSAMSAAADSKDAKEIAGAVSQSYKTLTDGSTMTVAELENGLATKLTRTDLDGYATQIWTQNQIKVTADGINATLSSIKSTVDGQTTSINDLKADSKSFKGQFTTVTDALGKQTTDIATLQGTSKTLTSNIQSLTSDNQVNKNSISNLQQTATTLSSTLMTVQTTVQNSAVGNNLLRYAGDFSGLWTLSKYSSILAKDGSGDKAIHYGGKSTDGTNGIVTQQTFTEGQLQANTWYTVSFWARGAGDNNSVGNLTAYFYSNGSDKYYSNSAGATCLSSTDTHTDIVLASGWQHYAITFHTPVNMTGSKTFLIRNDLEDNLGSLYCDVWHPKLELGQVATDFSTNSTDNATVTALSTVSQTVDGMKLDIAKKIEQSDLAGYATQTWTSNQINVTAGTINADLAKVTTTVNGHTTSINSLTADASGFKTQISGLQVTNGKNTTDIATLQGTSKTLTSNIQSLTTDNQTNKTNISNLQQTATSLNSTIMTVQTTVQNSAVGTNLLLYAGTFEKQWTFSGSNYSSILDSGNHDYYVHYATGTHMTWDDAIMQQSVQLEPSTYYTASFYARGNGGTGKVGKLVFYLYANASDKLPTDNRTEITLTAGFKRYTITFRTPADLSGNKIFLVRNDSGLNNAALYADVWRPKLELGQVATDFSINSTDSATVTALTAVSQTVSSLSTTVQGKVDNTTYQTKVTQLSNQLTSKISYGEVTNENLVPYSGYWDTIVGWSMLPWGESGATLRLIKHNFYHNAQDTTLAVSCYTTTGKSIQSQRFPVKRNTKYTFQFKGFASNNVKGTGAYFLGRAYGSANDYDTTGIHHLCSDIIMSPSHIDTYTATFTTSATDDEGYIRFDNSGTINGAEASIFVTEIKMETGSTATAYTRASGSEMVQTVNDINLRVTKNGVVNAVNVSTEGIQIYGNKLHITAATYIDNAIIKSAMIDTITADKITAGTLNATKVNVVNLNASNITMGTLNGNNVNVINLKASNITTGTINGTNLSINLDTGTVMFKKGYIGSVDGRIRLDMDNGYLSSFNTDNNGFEIEDGQIKFYGHFLGSETKNYIGGLSYDFFSNSMAGVNITGVNGVEIQQENKNDNFAYLSVGDAGLSSSGNIRLWCSGIASLDSGNNSIWVSSTEAWMGGLDTKVTIMGSNIDIHAGFGTGANIDINAGFGKITLSSTTISNLAVTGSKNAAVVTRDGVRLTPAYEMAESYFGDMGEATTDATHQIKVPIEELFGDTVNTSVPYQVFVQSYSSAHVWVSLRDEAFFVVQSDVPNVPFVWQVMAKRRGYESERLMKSDMSYEEYGKTFGYEE